MADGVPAAGQDPPPRPRRYAARLGKSVPFAAGALVMLVAVLLYVGLAPGPTPISQQDIDRTVASALASVTPPPAFSQLAFEAVEPSVVLIQTEEPDKAGKPQAGLGSGVVVNSDGTILTALHVVADATSIELTFADGTTSGAEVVTREPANDIAVIRAMQPPANLVPATLGNPGSVREGSEAFTLGSPFGLAGSMSSGVISGLDRSFKMPDSDIVLHGLFQIDAAVNPGNSGGPLVDREGDVIGIVTALVNPTKDEVFVGIGLAVPIDVAGGAAGLPSY